MFANPHLEHQTLRIKQLVEDYRAGRIVIRVSPNVGQKNGLNKVVVGTFEMGTDCSRFPPQVENHLICLTQESMPSPGPKLENRLQDEYAS